MNSQGPAVDIPVEPLIAPNRLTADSRLDFRRSVLESLEQAANAGAGVVEVDLSITTEMDASGLGVLVLLQKRARERGLETRLLNAPRVVRQMLNVTRLEALFDMSPRA